MSSQSVRSTALAQPRALTIPASPEALRALDADRLPEVAHLIRQRLVEITATTGGHLGPNLGVVELTLALHREFDSPREPLVFDTGHQAYVHKMLTGRPDLAGLRQRGGVSGYPDRGESEHDVVENSHASGSIAWAHGIDRGRRLVGPGARGTDDGHGPAEGSVVAIIGDGALTGGVGLEALNDLAADPASAVVVVLNDNTRSYAPTIGGLAAHLAALRAGDVPAGADVFTALGLTYLGPVDGHDLDALAAVLAEAHRIAADPHRGAPVVHVLTRKGMGFERAERDVTDHWHATGPFQIDLPSPEEAAAETVPAPDAPARPATWTARAGEVVLDAARADDRVVAVSAAMIDPVGLTPLQQAMPERVIDVGIAEQLALDTAAGLSHGGAKPLVALYSTFLNRAIDQLLLDVALHHEDVTITLDRAGVTGDDGPSHHGIWDLSLAAQVPGLAAFAPRDGERLDAAIRTALALEGPALVRYPKGGCGADVAALAQVPSGDVLAGDPARAVDALVVSIGALARPTVEAARRAADETGANVLVVDPVQALPISEELIALAASARAVVTVEDGVAVRGVGAALALALGQRATASHPTPPVRNLGVAQGFHAHATRAHILAEHGLDAEGIARSIRDVLG
ncbi:1-deoxy-D-xylulose-5-phosphate synthase [Brachybacterium huguangmaarense]|uniref:1-deoxy-D-xylulose-5-phosphate synthase n=1 Tax=Brachybacterium huguangmaarense TaxID=1652028 RepID=A0ABY6FZU1_9MICO|nr:1-deoxy-D-xylulose-5-phosphate synthase [Brachybacterium huguangmaarense]UYG16469.1 1-deoxy-D-xylulose-5-phosphate synthase [Brachybacterium huguangmaarense]